jgi:prophage regulatory protein
MNRPDPPLTRSIRKAQLLQMVPLADSTIWEMEQRGEFPKRFLLTPRCVVWDLAEVEAWLALRRTRPITRATPPDVHKRLSRPVRDADRRGGVPFRDSPRHP